jgi:hypothetical protein
MSDGAEYKLISDYKEGELMKHAVNDMTILVGYTAGKQSINGMDSALLAKRLSEGKLGKTRRGWNFLTAGMRTNRDVLNKVILDYFNGKENAHAIGFFAKENIKAFVRSGYYIATNPNRFPYIKKKQKLYSEIRPLIATGQFIEACDYVIINEEK